MTVDVLELLEKRQSAWLVHRTYHEARQVFNSTEIVRRDCHIIKPYLAILRTNENRRQTTGQTFIRFISMDFTPDAIRGSEAIVIINGQLPHEHHMRWLEVQRIMDKHKRVDIKL